MSDNGRQGFRARDGLTIAATVIGAGAVLLVALGTWKWFVRKSAPWVLDWPGGPWAVGAVFGLVMVAGSIGALWFSAVEPGASKPRRAGRVAGVSICGGLTFGAFMYVLGALPGKNCSSSRLGCEYIPGSGSALISSVLTAAVVGWLTFRVGRARAEAQAARERARMKKLRKKGKGKSRAAR
ncbi:hypothetical protein QF035_006097 [Streptomyces umbrinus]|uniref:Integral membrane protein n=1 Tax=Streptomyces umbrinus TaxID=67370 RepID=A0ABU0SY76_9ACTN|nr:hypothetical protein [Streptomyces umbrinus]MDQ1028515.1 hypothetical protein [Streptomyces umbrinus]